MRKKIFMVMLLVCLLVSSGSFTINAKAVSNVSDSVVQPESIISYGWVPSWGLGSIEVPGGHNVNIISDRYRDNLMSSGDFVGEQLYMVWIDSPFVRYDSPYGKLYRMDPSTGDQTLVGSVEAVGISGFAYDTTTNIAYISNYGALYTIDLTDASVRMVGFFEQNTTLSMMSIAVNADGVMYGIDRLSDTLYTINKETGERTPVGSLGIDIDMPLQDICFDRFNNILYGALTLPESVGEMGYLCKIDVETGAAEILQPIHTILSAFAIPYIVHVDFYDGESLIKTSFVEGSNETVEKPDMQAKLGFTLTGWNTAMDGSGIAYKPEENLYVKRDTTLYAQWVLNDYYVSYEGNAETEGTAPVDDTTYHMGDVVTVQDNTGDLTKTGYHFTGWNTQEDGDGITYIPGDTIDVKAEGIILYAQWEFNDYFVYYDGNGHTEGSVPVDVTEYHMGDNATVLENMGDLGRTGYHFTGWNTQEDGKGAAYIPGSEYTMGTQDMVFYAMWEKDPVVVNYQENTEDSFIRIAEVEGSVILPEVDGKDVLAITVYLEVKTGNLETFLIETVKGNLRDKGYVLLDIYDLQLMKRIVNTDGSIIHVPVANEEITAPLTIRIPLTAEQALEENLAMAFVDEEGNTVTLGGEIVELEGKKYIEFETDHFSDYALTQMIRVANPSTGVKDDMNMTFIMSVLAVGFMIAMMFIGSKKKRKS